MRTDHPDPVKPDSPQRVDRRVFSVGRMEDQTSEYVTTWRQRPAEERIAACRSRCETIHHDGISIPVIALQVWIR